MAAQFALVGFGEAGSTFARSAGWHNEARAYDIDPARTLAMQECGVTACRELPEALRGTDLVLSLVTAGQALAAAQEACLAIASGAIFCDMNSVAPQTKRAAAEAIRQHGGRYVDVAVLAPVNPAGMNVPLLLSGDDGGEAAQALARLGFTNLRGVGDRVGQASAIKMIRSVMVKGLEALSDEMMAAAEAAGVVDEVLASLDASEKRIGWTERAAYNLERMTTHGLRRAAEMEESARTLTDLGVEPVMTNGTVRRQRDAAGKGEA